MRHLGYMESIHARTQRLGGAIQFVSGCRLDGRLERDLALLAWKRLFDSHPLLRARIAGTQLQLTTQFPLARDCMRQYLQDPVAFRHEVSAHVDPIIDFVGETATPFFRHGPILSNLGVININTRAGALTWKSFDFAIRNAPINGSVAIAICTYHGQMSCLFNFNTPLVKPSTANKFMEDFVRVLRYAAS